jgi:hypothetical protein
MSNRLINANVQMFSHSKHWLCQCTQSSTKSDQKDNRKKNSFGVLSKFKNEKRQTGQFIKMNNTLYEDLLQHQSAYIRVLYAIHKCKFTILNS